jgi:hypothetical protein
VRKRTDMRRISLYVRQTSHSLLPTSTSTKRRRQPIFAIGCRLFCNLSHLFRVGQVTAHTLRLTGARVKVNLHTRPGNTVGTFVPKFATTFLPHAHGRHTETCTSKRARLLRITPACVVSHGTILTT